MIPTERTLPLLSLDAVFTFIDEVSSGVLIAKPVFTKNLSLPDKPDTALYKMSDTLPWSLRTNDPGSPSCARESFLWETSPGFLQQMTNSEMSYMSTALAFTSYRVLACPYQVQQARVPWLVWIVSLVVLASSIYYLHHIRLVTGQRVSRRYFCWLVL